MAWILGDYVDDTGCVSLRRDCRRGDGAGGFPRSPLGAEAPVLLQPVCMPWVSPAGGQFSSFMPSERPRCASTSLISVSDFLPRFGVFSSSTSVFWIRSLM